MSAVIGLPYRPWLALVREIVLERTEALSRVEYRDLDIEMTDLKADGSFSVRVIGQAPDGREMRADEAERPFLRSDDVDLLIGKVERRRASQEELLNLGIGLVVCACRGRSASCSLPA